MLHKLPSYMSLAFLLNWRPYTFIWVVRTYTNMTSQLTHCWLGIAMGGTSAMAPNIWSVRPWFFCRAFILLSSKQKKKCFYPSVITISVSLCISCSPSFLLLECPQLSLRHNNSDRQETSHTNPKTGGRFLSGLGNVCWDRSLRAPSSPDKHRWADLVSNSGLVQ